MKRTTINEKKNNKHPTWYMKYLAESAVFELCTLNKLCNDLTVNRFEMPNFSYRQSVMSHIKQRQ